MPEGTHKKSDEHSGQKNAKCTFTLEPNEILWNPVNTTTLGL